MKESDVEPGRLPPSMAAGRRKPDGQGFWRYFRMNYDLYLMCVPGLIFLIVYKFAPLLGLSLAFKDFNLFAGNNIIDSIIKSPWVGMKHFNRIFEDEAFLKVIGNTLIISLYKLVFLFPIPIIVAISLNELRIRLMKRWVQTIVYLPHFLSWVIIFGLFYSLFGSYGMINKLLEAAGGESISFFSDSSWFRSLLVFTEGWKETGWNTILFLAAMTAIDPQQHEAAVMDGAGRFKRIWHITIPGIVPVILLVLILRLGQILNAGFEQVLVMYNPAVYDVADIIQTFVYRIGLGKMDFSLSTALGLFESVVAFILVYSSNQLGKRYLGKSIW
ncbi:ABC transporter permease [Paenibacillus nasutitermitis]|uniref:Protein LplB n=1 Tax=Paenibacillus nasutitermitis TaxID=1652958 RepID=A0A916ZDM6_9BACL|nr:ABC transporter permease subunit [Paenibacillus nasutitermitis]GGD90890.1 protein LplB [Paenibacillus nasutitermitis]